MKYLVDKALLDLHDKYTGDLGLLDERWSHKEDREVFSSEQLRTLGEYLEKMHLAKGEYLSQELKMQTESRIKELEAHIDPEVLTILRKRLAPTDVN